MEVSLEDFELSLEVPPEVPSLELEVPELDWPAAFSASLPEDSEVAELEDPVELLPVELEVELALAAACSALVSFGGVISGVLFGTGSETLVPPQALRPAAASSASTSASVRRALTAGPCACRRWGNR